MTRIQKFAAPAFAAAAFLSLPTGASAITSAPSLAFSPALLFGVAIFAPTLLLAMGFAAGLLADLLQRSEAV